MEKISIYADGACSGNPGPGGWGAVIFKGETTFLEIGGAAKQTTNNRMEITAAVEGLKAVRDLECPVEIISDSKYLIGGATAWMAAWKRKNWRTAQGHAVLNRDLWEALDALMSKRGKNLSWRHVLGHSGCPGNERADQIAAAFSKGSPVELQENGFNVWGFK